MNIFIAGASSFAGEYLTKFLLKRKKKVFGTYFKNKLKIKSSYFVPINSDLTKKITFKKKCKFLIHIASYHQIEDFKKNPRKKKSRNILMTKNLLNYSLKNNIKKIIFFSTIDINKVNFYKQKKNYIESKIASEKIYLNSQKKNQIKIIILRLPAIIGKNCNKNFLKNTYEKLKKNKIVNLWDPDKLYDNFVHVEDLSRFVYSIITKSTKLTQSIVECKSSKPIRLRDTISFMKKKLNSKSKIKINNVVKKTDRFRRVFFSTNSFNFYSSKKAILKFLKENN